MSTARTVRAVTFSVHRPAHTSRFFCCLWATFALAVAFLAPRAAHATYVFKGVMASKVYQRTTTLAANTTYKIETSALAPSTCDPVMYLYRTADYKYPLHNDNISSTNRNARITVAITAQTAGTYDIIIRAKAAGCTGSVKINDAVVESAMPFGGSLVTLSSTVPGSPTQIEYQTALIRGGTTDTRLWGINSAGDVVAFSDDEGVWYMSRFVSPNTRAVLVGSFSPTSAGKTDLYVNPQNGEAPGGGFLVYDNDDDGLAEVVENEIGTCDRLPCAFAPNAAHAYDTDHDGLSDSIEIFGVDDPNYNQLLPLWGANPKHKDVFLELDWTPDFASNPFTAADAQQLISYLSVAPNAAVLNPDGSDGVNLHIDLGVANGNGTAFGAWGGANRVVVDPDDWTHTMNNAANFNPVRWGIFRHAFIYKGSTGAAGVANRFITWPGDENNRNMVVLSHELGHSLGLEHHGHNSWGAGNCKPHYYSTMNYLYIGVPYSTGYYASTPLTPSGVTEGNPFGTKNFPTFLSQAPLYYPFEPRNVDWNRDGFTSNPSPLLRAPLRWSPGGAPGGGCDAFTADGTWFDSGAVLFSQMTPELVKYNGRIYMFYNSSGRVAYRSATIGGVDADGSCVAPNCRNWTAETILPVPGMDAVTGILGMTVTTWGNALVLAYRLSNGEVRWQMTNSPAAGGSLPNWNSNTVVGQMGSTPHLAAVYVNPALFAGATEILALFGSTNGTYWRWTLASNIGGVFAPTHVLDTGGNWLTGALSPAVVSWPSLGGVNHASIGTSCGVFTTHFGDPRFYCYDKSTDAWQDLSDIAYSFTGMPKTATKVGLAYHVLRTSTGSPLLNDPATGQFWMTVSPAADTTGDGVPDPSRSYPELYVSGQLSAGRPPSSSTMRWQIKGAYWDVNYSSDVGTTVGLYEDESISAMKSVWFQDNRKIYFMPYGDGTTSQPLKDGNDFEVMERGICMGVLGGPPFAESSCGALNKFGY